MSTHDQADYLKAAECMRSHGIAGFADPVFSGGNVNFPIPSGMDTNSTQFRRAREICELLVPPGLPYSSRRRVASSKASPTGGTGCGSVIVTAGWLRSAATTGKDEAGPSTVRPLSKRLKQLARTATADGRFQLREVEVELLGDRGVRPGRLLQPIHTLEREAAMTVRRKEHEPVGALGVRVAFGRGLVPWAV